MGLAATGAPLSPLAFPHPVIVYHDIYVKGLTGGAQRTPASGVAMQANVQLASDDKVERVYPDEGEAAGSITLYEVSFPADPLVKTDNTIVTSMGCPFGVLNLICIAPATHALAGQWFRVRCESRT